MLQPYPLHPVNMRARAQSNPSRPKTSRSNSSPGNTDSAELPSPSIGSRPSTAGSRSGTEESRPNSTTSGSLTPTPSLTFTPYAPSSPAQPSHSHEKKSTKKLQRPRRGSFLSFASTSSVQLVPTEPVLPTPTSSENQRRPVSSHSQSQPPTLPPVRPPRNPARIPTDIRPFSSSGARDHKALWDSSSVAGSTSSGSNNLGSPLLSKFVKRHKSASTNGRPATSTGVSLGSGSGSLLTKAGRTERRDRDKEREREREKEKEMEKYREMETQRGDMSPTSRRQRDSKRDKGKGKATDDRTSRERAERNSIALTHALNTYAFASASLVPKQSSSSLAHSIPSKQSSKPHPKSQSRPHSQIALSSTPRLSTVSGDSHSSTSTATNSSPSNPSDPGSSRKSHKGKEKAGPNFSTLDRTILEELTLSQTARDSQFLFKGPGGGLGQQGEKGIRHHPFAKEEVPYPRNYDRAVVDLDVWETSWCQQVCNSVTWHVFKTPPTKVLDLGCGAGTWIMECAKLWKQCHFVGLDIVPLHPDLKRVGSLNLAARISWVQSNFLEALPFPNEEFDYVHIKRIARGVPEDKWDALFEEITRVMKPGAAFEMVEEDLYWPGKSREADVDSESDSGSSPKSNTTSKISSPLVGTPITDASARSESPSTPRPTIRRNTEPIKEPIPSSTSDNKKNETIPLKGTATRRDRSPTPLFCPPTKNATIPSAGATARRDPSPKSLFQPPPLARSMSSSPPTTSGHALARPPALSISTMLSSPSRAAVNETVAEGKINSETLRPSTSTESGSTPSKSTHSRRRTSFSPSSPTTSISMSPQFSQFSPVKPSFSYPHLVRTAPKAPVNPRDHTVLETIYAETHAKRFINLAPLSLLPNNLSTWFKDVRTHPPLNVTFPPPPTHPRVRSTQTRPDAFSTPQIGSDDDDDYLETSPVKTVAPKAHGSGFQTSHSAEGSQNTIRRKPQPINTQQNTASPTIISLQGLLLGESPYAYLDDARFTAFSPSAKASFPSPHGEHSTWDKVSMLPVAVAVTPASAPSSPQSGSQDAEAPDYHTIAKTSVSLERLPSTSVPNTQTAEAAQTPELEAALATFKIRLPNTTLQIDLRTLNLHLALRTLEILACAEAMWEWVLEFQVEQAKEKENGRLRSGSVGGSLQPSKGGQPMDPPMVVIAELTRPEFDGLLTQFNLDMRDQFALGSALEERFAWSVVPMPATQDLKLFDIACDKWEQYQRQQRLDQIGESQPGPYRRHSQLLSEAAATLGHLPTIPDTITMRNGSTRPTVDFADARPGTQQAHLSGSNSGRRGGHRTLSKSHSYASLPKEPDLPEPLGEEISHPSHLLCRTMRVFVAWKA